MLDPVKNAKVMGFLFIILGVLKINSLIVHAGESESIELILNACLTLIPFVVGIGLFQKKLWGVYGNGLLVVLIVLEIIYNYFVLATVSVGDLVSLAIYIVLFLWFWSAKQKFSK